ncbi:hypothetical protein D3C85_1349390 [compost metagenome]
MNHISLSVKIIPKRLSKRSVSFQTARSLAIYFTSACHDHSISDTMDNNATTAHRVDNFLNLRILNERLIRLFAEMIRHMQQSVFSARLLGHNGSNRVRLHIHTFTKSTACRDEQTAFH